MRNGNLLRQARMPTHSLRFEPTYEEMETAFSRGIFDNQFYRYERTYEEWKLCSHTAGFAVISCFELTYEEWEPGYSEASAGGGQG